MSYYLILTFFFPLMENTQYTSRAFTNFSKFILCSTKHNHSQCNNSNNDGREVCCKVTCGDHYTAYRRYYCYSVVLIVLRAYYFTEYARTYVFHHDFTHEIREKRTGWQPCSYQSETRFTVTSTRVPVG